MLDRCKSPSSDPPSQKMILIMIDRMVTSNCRSYIDPCI